MCCAPWRRSSGSSSRCRRASPAPAGTIGVEGGAVRSESVRAALAAAGPGDPGTWCSCTTRRGRWLTAELARGGARGARWSDECVDAAIAAAPVTDTVKRVDDGGVVVETLDRARAVGGADAAGLPPRGAGAGARRARRRCWRRRPTTPGWSSAPGGGCAIVPSDEREPQGHHAAATCELAELLLARRRASPAESCLNRSRPMLTDYHLHLRPTTSTRPRAEHFTAANVERYRERGAASAGSPSSGVSEHIYRFEQALERVAAPVLARIRARRPRRLLRVRARADRPAAGDRGRLRAGRARIAWRTCSSARLRLRGRLGALPARARRSTWTTTACGSADAAPRRSGERYFQTLGEAARSGLFDILAHPDLVKVWGPATRSARARGRPAPLLRAGDRGDRRIGDRGRGLDRRAAQARARDLPGAGVPARCASRPVRRSRSRATRTGPRTSAPTTTQALELLERVGRRRAVRVRAPRAPAGADRGGAVA